MNADGHAAGGTAQPGLNQHFPVPVARVLAIGHRMRPQNHFIVMTPPNLGSLGIATMTSDDALAFGPRWKRVGKHLDPAGI